MPADDNTIRPFQVGFPEAELTELRRRVNATRWPERETVTDDSQGVRLAMMQELARYWGTDYDWGTCEAKLNALPHFMTEIDGLDIHFIHVRSQHRGRAAADRHARVARLDHRAAEDHRAAHQSHGAWRERGRRVPPGDPLAAGPRVLRQADRHRLGSRPHRTCLGRADEAPGIHPVRRAGRRLGRGRHADDGYTGRAGAARHPLQHARYRAGRHQPRRFERGDPPPAGLSAEEKSAYEQLRNFYAKHVAYAQIMTTRPQTLYGLADSPADLAAFMLDHGDGTGQPGLVEQVLQGHLDSALTRDDILDNITLYWLTNTGVSAARLYWENKADFFDAKNITIPFAISVFPDELYQAPRSWAERAYPGNLIYFNKLDRGGHFAAWEQPDLFAAEMRAAFRSLR